MLIGLGAKSQVLHDLGVVILFANKKVLFGEVDSIQGLGEQLSAETVPQPVEWAGALNPH